MTSYRKAASEDVYPALELAYRVFMENTAPDFEPEAAVIFKKDCIENKTYTTGLISGSSHMFVASEGKDIVGMVAGWDNGEIQILFVDAAYHRLGIATTLMNNLICALKLRGQDKIKLDSSPRALPLPDHKTISRFRSENCKALKGVFRDFVKMYVELGLYGQEFAAIDGSQFKAVNSMDRNLSVSRTSSIILDVSGYSIRKSG